MEAVKRVLTRFLLHSLCHRALLGPVGESWACYGHRFNSDHLKTSPSAVTTVTMCGNFDGLGSATRHVFQPLFVHLNRLGYLCVIFTVFRYK